MSTLPSLPPSPPLPVSPPTSARIKVVVMGVSGSGKSSVGAGIAAALGLRFIDGDALHSAQAVAKMQAGIALHDDDRWPWLDRIGSCLADPTSGPHGVVVACSALKRVYRDRIRRAAAGVRFVFLDGSAALIGARLSERVGHYMPATLLASQLQTLEPPGLDEPDASRESIERSIDDIVADAVRRLHVPPYA